MKRLLLCLLALTAVSSAQPSLTLWGVTMGQPVPATFTKCSKHSSDNTPCIRPRNSMFDGKNSVVLAHLPYPSGELRLAVLDQKVSHMITNKESNWCHTSVFSMEPVRRARPARRPQEERYRHGTDSPSFSDLVTHADAALYSAKHKGRNRVEFAV